MGREDGKINFGTIFSVVLVVTVIYLAIIFVPVYIDNAKLEEAVRYQARHAKGSSNNDRIVQGIFEEVDTLGLDIPFEAVDIKRHGKRIEITMHYIREVRFKPTTHFVRLQLDIRESS